MDKAVTPKNCFPQVELEEVCEKISVGLAISVTPYMREKGTKLIRNQNIRPNYFDSSSLVYLDDEFAKSQASKLVRSGDVISVRTGANIGDTCVVPDDFDGALTFTTLIVRPKKNLLDSHYLSQYMNSSLGRAETNRLMAGGGKGNLNAGELKKYKVFLPAIHEQRKIAGILGAWDKVIALTEKTIAAKQKLKKGFMQKILSNPFWNQIDSKTEHLIKEWQLKELSSCFVERRETSSDLEKYPLYSLTIEDGLIKKPDRYNREFLLKDKEDNQYRLVYSGDFVYNPMNLRFGAIAISSLVHTVAISAYYNVLIPNADIIYPDFLFSLLTSPRMIYIYDSFGKGSLVEKKRVHLSDFFQIKIPLPSLEEQKKIAQFLTLLDKEEKLMKVKLKKLQAQKRGLMQKLLTGEWRVNIEETTEELTEALP